MKSLDKTIAYYKEFIRYAKQWIIIKGFQIWEQKQRKYRKCDRCLFRFKDGYELKGKFRCRSCTVFMQTTGQLPITLETQDDIIKGFIDRLDVGNIRF